MIINRSITISYSRENFDDNLTFVDEIYAEKCVNYVFLFLTRKSYDRNGPITRGSTHSNANKFSN